MAGNFYESAEAVRLDGPVLFARLRNVDGGWEDAEIDLNEFIGNVGSGVSIILNRCSL